MTKTSDLEYLTAKTLDYSEIQEWLNQNSRASIENDPTLVELYNVFKEIDQFVKHTNSALDGLRSYFAIINKVLTRKEWLENNIELNDTLRQYTHNLKLSGSWTGYDIILPFGLKTSIKDSSFIDKFLLSYERVYEYDTIATQNDSPYSTMTEETRQFLEDVKAGRA
jgi:hypothetical protein